MEEGKYYLFATPWDWTFLGQYVRHVNSMELVIRNGGYFTRTGATFDILTSMGFTRDTQFHPTVATVENPNCEQIIPATGPKWIWGAPKPWLTSEGGS